MPGTADFRPNIWGATDGAPVSSYHIDRDRRDIDISSDIYKLLPDANPFLVILMQARKNPVNSLEYIWFDEEPASWKTKVASSYGDDPGDTTIEVADGSIFVAKDIAKNTRTGEILFITEVSNNTLTVERQYGYEEISSSHIGGTERASGAVDDYLLRLGNAMEENSRAPDTRAYQPIKLYNYVQTFRLPFDASNDVTHEGKATNEDERTRLRRIKAIEHRMDIERALLFGERNEHIASKRRTTGGLMQFIKTNYYDVGTSNQGILTEPEWENFCEMAFDWGSDRKLFICSRRVGSIINQFAAGRINTVSGEESYGLRLQEYQSFHGQIMIAPSKVFEKEYYGDMGVMVDIENIDYRPFAGEDSTLKMNIQEPDRDGWKDEYMTKVGSRVRLEKTHAVLKGAIS